MEFLYYYLSNSIVREKRCLQNRILSKEDYQIHWLDWCKREARKFDKS